MVRVLFGKRLADRASGGWTLVWDDWPRVFKTRVSGTDRCDDEGEWVQKPYTIVDWSQACELTVFTFQVRLFIFWTVIG